MKFVQYNNPVRGYYWLTVFNKLSILLLMIVLILYCFHMIDLETILFIAVLAAIYSAAVRITNFLVVAIVEQMNSLKAEINNLKDKI